jgi:hypothetical protein
MEDFTDDFFSKPINLDYDLKIPDGINLAEVFKAGL